MNWPVAPGRQKTAIGAWAMPAAARLGLVRMAVGRLARSLPEPAATALRAEDGTVAATREPTWPR